MFYSVRRSSVIQRERVQIEREGERKLEKGSLRELITLRSREKRQTHEKMRIILLLSLIGLSSTAADDTCQCAMFLNNDHWLPEDVAFNSTSRYNVDCSKFGEASEQCKILCFNEMESMRQIIRNGVSMQDKFPPKSDLPCVEKHTATLSFSRTCGSTNYVLTSTQYGPSVCCDASALIQWCSYDDAHYYQEQNLVEGRKLDLKKSKNDIENNEIDVMERPIKEKLKVSSVVVNSTSPLPSWMQSITGYFGYNNFMDFVRNVDIFSLPGKIQGAIKDYRDELSMGRCYMEFTTFKLFTKQENPFGDILRKKRNADETEEEINQNINDQPKKQGQVQAIEALIERFAERYGIAGEARQYSSLISTVVKLFAQFMNSQGESNGVGAASLLSLAGPLLSQMSSRPNEAHPTGGGTNVNPQESSPIPMMAMQLLGSALNSYFGSSENDTTKEKTPYPPYTKPEKPASGMGTGMGSILQLLANGANPPSPSPVRRKPIVSQARPETTVEEKKPKSFANMILDLIRPVFISIIGNTPGEGGVLAIRRVSALSTQGRVDNTLRDEVDSPFFCFKRYAVNKAWSLTETGVNTLVAKFTPEEQESMRRALS